MKVRVVCQIDAEAEGSAVEVQRWPTEAEAEAEAVEVCFRVW